MRLLGLLNESPDEAYYEDRYLSFAQQGSLTFGIAKGRIWSAFTNEAPKALDSIGNPGAMTHSKLSLIIAGLAETVAPAQRAWNVLSKLYGPYFFARIARNDEPEERTLDHMAKLLRSDSTGEWDGYTEEDYQETVRTHLAKIREFIPILKLSHEGRPTVSGPDFQHNGRAWYHPSAGILISFWDRQPPANILPQIISHCQDKFEVPDTDRVWVQDLNMSDDEWLPVGITAQSLDGDVRDRIMNLSAMLHTATPEQKQRIKAQIRELRASAGEVEEELPEWGSTRGANAAQAAGYDSTARHNATRREESLLSTVRRTLGEGETSYGDPMEVLGMPYDSQNISVGMIGLNNSEVDQQIIRISKVLAIKGAPPGTGTRFMTDLCKLADERSIILTLNPADRGDFKGGKHKVTSSRSRVVNFYKRFGFREAKSSDYYDYGGRMYRLPQ